MAEKLAIWNGKSTLGHMGVGGAAFFTKYRANKVPVSYSTPNGRVRAEI